MSDSAAQFHHDQGQPSAIPPANVDRQPPAPVRPRLWPAVIFVALMWAALTSPAWVPGLQDNEFQAFVPMLGAVGATALIGLWLLFASRIPWTDRILILLFTVTSGLASLALANEAFPLIPIVRGLPLALTGMVAWLAITPALSWPIRRLGAVVAILLGWGYCDLLRMDGLWGDFQGQITWRWAPRDEDAYLAELAKNDAPKTIAASHGALELHPGDWPGFRGPNRDSRLKGVRIATDWKAHPPKLLWKHRIGPGWSSFAVVGDRIYTQEQRGGKEAVICLDATKGDELWAHSDTTRFDETMGGPGPRSTPTFYEGKLYCLGANGALNCLDPLTGKVNWSHDIAADSGAKVPMWGFSASPLAAQGVVTVFAGGTEGKSVLGYQASSGELAWSAGHGKEGYGSTQLSSVGGADQLLVVAEDGLTSLEPAGGQVLWNYEWPTDRPPRVAQPAIVGDSDVLFATPFKGMRRLHVNHDSDKWDEQQVWETKDIKPYYNDLVVYKDHAYGFDNNIFTCVSLEDGKGKWRTRAYGAGQVILLVDQGLLLISSEKGDVALVQATPEAHKELGRFNAIEGKTWNHPVLAHGKLFIRNGEQVACFELAEEGGKGSK
jgi:outer membrane protein assembly factor BamB